MRFSSGPLAHPESSTNSVKTLDLTVEYVQLEAHI